MANNLKKIAKEKKISLYRLARIVYPQIKNYNYIYILAKQEDLSVASGTTLKKIAEALTCKIEDLIK